MVTVHSVPSNTLRDAQNLCYSHNKRYRIKIPNNEVREEFESLTSFYLNIEETVLDNLRQSLIDADENLFTATYQNILLRPSY